MELMSTRECAYLLRVTRDTIKGWAQRGEIPAIKLNGNTWRFDKEEIDKVIIP